MYENGGLYTGEYAIRCGHSKGSDPTTLAEQADYAQYTVEHRIKLAKSIFGNGCFVGSFGSLVEAGYAVGDHFLDSGVVVHYAGADVAFATDNGRHCVYGNIQGAWDKPIENPERYGVVCATFVSLAIWQAGLMDAATINQYGYNGTGGVANMINNSSYSKQWEKITDFDELQDGDVVITKGENWGHIWIYVEGCKCLDQTYCVVNSDGSGGATRSTYSARGNNIYFVEGYRYIGV